MPRVFSTTELPTRTEILRPFLPVTSHSGDCTDSERLRARPAGAAGRRRGLRCFSCMLLRSRTMIRICSEQNTPQYLGGGSPSLAGAVGSTSPSDRAITTESLTASGSLSLPVRLADAHLSVTGTGPGTPGSLPSRDISPLACQVAATSESGRRAWAVTRAGIRHFIVAPSPPRVCILV